MSPALPKLGESPVGAGHSPLRVLCKIVALLVVVCTALFTQPANARANTRVGDIWLNELPPEARLTLQQIDRGGPFPFRRDGVAFQNSENRLPEQPRNFYHEYTVPTPGASNRGARRIIVGGQPPLSFYYTDDHYRSFARIHR